MLPRSNRWLCGIVGVLSVAVLLLPAAHAGETGSKVFYGTDAKQNEFPFVVYYTNFRYPHFCTGSLIDRRWILTAAHCLGFNMTHVTLGDYIRPGIEGSEQVIRIAEEIRHPDYVEGYFLNHDIGLIRLAEPANIRSDAVAKISPLKSKSFKRKMLANEKSCRVLGWGFVKTENGYDDADRMQKLRLRFYTTEEAVAKGYDYFATLNGTLFTEAVYADDCYRGSGCFGDSGGPIVCKQRGKWVQTGIVSFGDDKNGCRSGIWVMADVQKYYSWIQSYL